MYRYCQYVGKDPDQVIEDITPRSIKAFFDWVLNQCRGKAGRRGKGVKSEDSLGTYYKVFWQVCQRATSTKIGGEHNNKGFNRMMPRCVG
jgi:hypothetical protein